MLERIYFAFIGIITTDCNKHGYKLLIFALLSELQPVGYLRVEEHFLAKMGTPMEGGMKWDSGLLIGVWMEPAVTFLRTAQLHLSCGSGRAPGSFLRGVLSAASKAMVEFSFKKDDVLQSSYL